MLETALASDASVSPEPSPQPLSRWERGSKSLPTQLLVERGGVVVVGLVDDHPVLDPHEAHALDVDALVLRRDAHEGTGVGAGEGPLVGDAVAGGDGFAAQGPLEVRH